jgi:hypothetical protein
VLDADVDVEQLIVRVLRLGEGRTVGPRGCLGEDEHEHQQQGKLLHPAILPARVVARYCPFE